MDSVPTAMSNLSEGFAIISELPLTIFHVISITFMRSFTMF
jgi:hypothetical protein